jgi:hypothetical protein
MNDNGRAIVEAMHREAKETDPAGPWPKVERKGVHFTQLPKLKPGEVFFQEWNTYCREVGRLLNEGQEGRYVLIKGELIIGVHDTWAAARESGLQRFLLEPFFVHLIRPEEPYIRVR